MERQFDVPRSAYVGHKIGIRVWEDGFNCTAILYVGGAVHRVVGILIPMDAAPSVFDYWAEQDALPYWHGYPSEMAFLDVVIALALSS